MLLVFRGCLSPARKSLKVKKKSLISSCPGYRLGPGFLITTPALPVSVSLQHSQHTKHSQTFNEVQTGSPIQSSLSSISNFSQKFCHTWVFYLCMLLT